MRIIFLFTNTKKQFFKHRNCFRYQTGIENCTSGCLAKINPFEIPDRIFKLIIGTEQTDELAGIGNKQQSFNRCAIFSPLAFIKPNGGRLLSQISAFIEVKRYGNSEGFRS